ncbi:Elongation of very long chain fatty acids protein 1 [Halotydeus destructor]|nr:Elongation of very long chain fatty acids protein 1 [Halotydeus destructor]
MEALDKWADYHGHHVGNQWFPGFPWKVVFIVLSYLAFVLKVGPAVMANRKPMQLKWPMRIYNAINVIACSFITIFGLHLTRFFVSSWQCIDITEPGHGPRWLIEALSLGYVYLKIFDLLDTVFFVLRKKDNQITLLHLVHHSIMPLTSTLAAKVAPNSFASQIVILNSFVHVLMYTYYFLASFGPEMQKYLWWKRHVTEIQLIQFVIVLAQSTYFITVLDCPGAHIIPHLQMIEAGYFLFTFAQFYIRAYSNSRKVKSG